MLPTLRQYCRSDPDEPFPNREQAVSIDCKPYSMGGISIVQVDYSYHFDRF